MEMEGWLTGRKITDKRNFHVFDFFNKYVKEGLQPYDDLKKPIPPPGVGKLYVDIQIYAILAGFSIIS